MINGERVLAIVPARGGSKGLAGKNIAPLRDKPLIAWTIEAARASAYVDRIILTSDDAEIIRVGVRYGCEAPFIRPADLASDTAPGMAPVLHALEQIADGDVVVLLQPTSPLRSAPDIDACIEGVVHGRTVACVSVTEVKHPPEHMFSIGSQGMLNRLMNGEVPARRQDIPRYVALNGAVYAARRSTILEHRTFLAPGVTGYLMPIERSVDIDGVADLEYAEWLLTRRQTAVELR